MKGIQEKSGRSLEAVQDILSTLCPLSLSIATVNAIVDTMVGYCLLMRKKMMMSGGVEQAYYAVESSVNVQTFNARQVERSGEEISGTGRRAGSEEWEEGSRVQMEPGGPEMAARGQRVGTRRGRRAARWQQGSAGAERGGKGG